MSDGFDISNEEGDFIHINYLTSEERNKQENDEELYGDENDWVLVQKSNNSKLDPPLDSQRCHLEYEEVSTESSHKKSLLESSFYELVTESLKETRDECVIKSKTALSTSEFEAELLYLPDEKLENDVPCTIDNTENNEQDILYYCPNEERARCNKCEGNFDDDIDSEEYRFIHEYNEEVDICAKTKAHSELLDIYPNSFMGVDTKNDLLGGRSRKRRCKKVDLNKKAPINSRFYSFKINKDALWVYKNA